MSGREQQGSRSVTRLSFGKGLVALRAVLSRLTWLRRPCFRRLSWGALELGVVLLCLSTVIFARLLRLEPIEVGGDALKVWEFARHLAYGGGLPDKFNHHTSRFGLVLPSLFVQWIWGSQATSYFIGPLAASTILHLLVYLIGRKVAGPLAGAIAVFALLSFSPMGRASSQILPETFGPMYIAVATFAALQFTDAKGRWPRRLWLTLVGFGIIGAYGSKMSYLYFAPGVALLAWFGGVSRERVKEEPLVRGRESRTSFYFKKGRRSFRERGLLTPTILVVFVVAMGLVEWLFFATVTAEQNAGRLAVVTGSHSAAGAEAGHQVRSAADFFALYTRAPQAWLRALLVGALALLGVGAFARDKRAKLLALGLFIYFLLQTFVLRKLSPPTPWMEPHPRYLIAMAAPIAIMIGVFINDALRAVVAGQDPTSERHPSLYRFLILLAAAGLFLRIASEIPEPWQTRWGTRDGWHRTEKEAHSLSAAFAAGIPIVSETPKGKPAWAAAAVFISPDLLMKEGRLSHEDFMRKLGRGRYVARALGSSDIGRKKLDNAVSRRKRARRCAVMLRQRSRFMSGRKKFRATCESLEEQFENDPKAGKPLKKRSGRKGKRSKR